MEAADLRHYRRVKHQLDDGTDRPTWQEMRRLIADTAASYDWPAEPEERATSGD